MKLEQAARQALEALEQHVERFDYEQFTSVCELDPAKDAILALQEALAEQAEQKPVASVSEVYQSRYTLEWNGRSLPVGAPLYAAPVRTKDLTDDEIESFVSEHRMADYIYRSQAIAMCRAVIAADREKNRG